MAVLFNWSSVSGIQESLANAKVSARQPWYIGHKALNRPPLRIAQQYQCYLHIVEKYVQCTTIPSLTMRVYLHSFSRCCLPNMPTSAQFPANLNLQQFKVIQGRWFWYQSKVHIRVLLVTIVTLVLTCIVSEIWRLIGWKLRIFHTPLLFGAPAHYLPFGISRWS